MAHDGDGADVEGCLRSGFDQQQRVPTQPAAAAALAGAAEPAQAHASALVDDGDSEGDGEIAENLVMMGTGDDAGPSRGDFTVSMSSPGALRPEASPEDDESPPPYKEGSKPTAGEGDAGTDAEGDSASSAALRSSLSSSFFEAVVTFPQAWKSMPVLDDGEAEVHCGS